MTGHYGELVFGLPKGIDVLLSPMIYTLPSFLQGHVADTLACPRVMAAPENIRAGFIKERDVFADHGIRYVSPLVALAEPRLAAKQLFEALEDVFFGLTLEETEFAVADGYRALEAFNEKLRGQSREILSRAGQTNKPCLQAVAPPYQLDSGRWPELDVELPG